MSAGRLFLDDYCPDRKQKVRKPNVTAWCLLVGGNTLDWDLLKAWRARAQQNGDSKDQPKADRRLWQRRTKAAGIVCNIIWPKSGNGPRIKDLPVELEEEILMAVTMGFAV